MNISQSPSIGRLPRDRHDIVRDLITLARAACERGHWGDAERLFGLALIAQQQIRCTRIANRHPNR